MSSCVDLPFAERIGFESNPDGSFDKFSSIKVRDQTYPLVSLVGSPPPKAQKPGNLANAPAGVTVSMPGPKSD